MSVCAQPNGIGGLHLVCNECGGTCPSTENKYDDVMHLEGCPRRRRLNVLAKFEDVTVLERQAHNCSIDERLNTADISRTCPAWRHLMGVVTSNPVPAKFCGRDQTDICYDRHYKKHEERVLELSFAIDEDLDS